MVYQGGGAPGAGASTCGDALPRAALPSAGGAGVLGAGETDASGRCGIIPAMAEAPAGRPEMAELLSLLRRVAKDGEVLVAISNYTPVLNGMLVTWVESVKRAGVENYVIVAIDDNVQAWCRDQGHNCWHRTTRPPKAQDNTGDNHAISAAKFLILSDFLEAGVAVLLSDVDVLTVSNPFERLYRDHDVEGMTDGFDERWAYGMIDGFDDPTMGWARFAQIYKRFAMNSGLFYLRPTRPALALMRRCADRLEREKYWDQTVYNEEMFFMSHGDYRSPQVTVRVMGIDDFMNSKRLFKTVRYLPRADQPVPAMVHMNYHPDKHERMKAAARYYFDGDASELMRFPGGSEPGS